MHQSYNDRLFKSGLRRRLHLARFHWLRRSILKRGAALESVLELGCFDGKTLQFLPEKPARYCGYDANWENGLAIARNTWRDDGNIEFVECNAPGEFTPSDRGFATSICMETLEHLPPAELDTYLATLAAATCRCAFVSVPNEIGAVFAAKYLAKRLRYGSARDYSWKEFMWATLGRLDRVARDQHKGFDFRKLITQMQKHFQIVEVTGLPFAWLPPALNFTVGIVAIPKHACGGNTASQSPGIKAA